MSFEKNKRKKSGGIVDLVYGDDTEAFLDELVNDDFLDWHSSEPDNEGTTATAKHQTDKQNLEALLTTNDKNIKPARKALETLEGEQPSTETPTRAKLPTTYAPQKRWTRFPTRVPTAQDHLTQKSSLRNEGCAEHSSTSKDGVASSVENDILDASNLLSRMELNRSDVWEDEPDSKFEERHKKMETYLENLRQDDRKKRKMRTDETLRRRNSDSSVESVTTNGSSSSSSSCPSQQQSLDMRYVSACTVEEVIDCKMKDVEEKFNNNICDAWIDDVELALMLIKRKSKERDLKNDKAKNLVNIILEQK